MTEEKFRELAARSNITNMYGYSDGVIGFKFGEVNVEFNFGRIDLKCQSVGVVRGLSVDDFKVNSFNNLIFTRCFDGMHDEEIAVIHGGE